MLAAGRTDFWPGLALLVTALASSASAAAARRAAPRVTIEALGSGCAASGSTCGYKAACLTAGWAGQWIQLNAYDNSEANELGLRSSGGECNARKLGCGCAACAAIWPLAAALITAFKPPSRSQKAG